MLRTAWMFALAAAFLVMPASGRATAQSVVYYPPGVSYYPPPAVSYYSAPAVVVPAPAVSYYYTPTYSYYVPSYSYYAPSYSYYYGPPAAVTYTRYGPLGGVRYRTSYYYSPVFVGP
jgi:hypothetical protein